MLDPCSNATVVSYGHEEVFLSVFVKFSLVVLLTLIDFNSFQYKLTVAQVSISMQNPGVHNFCRLGVPTSIHILWSDLEMRKMVLSKSLSVALVIIMTPLDFL